MDTYSFIVLTLVLVGLLILLFLLAGWFKEVRAPGVDHGRGWQSIGTPPPLLDDALALIRQEFIFAYGDAVFAVPWRGFIEWDPIEQSRIVSAPTPLFCVRYAANVEDTKLADLLNTWIAGYLRVPPHEDLPVKIRSMLRVQFARAVVSP